MVVTFAPKFAAPLTLTEVAEEIAAFKSSPPVIAIVPTAFVPPTAPPNITSPVPTFAVIFLAVEFDEFNVPEKPIFEFDVINVLFAPRVVLP